MIRKPGKSFVQMFDRMYENNFAKAAFSDRLLIGIFWEESFSNNIFQIGGRTGAASAGRSRSQSNFARFRPS